MPGITKGITSSLASLLVLIIFAAGCAKHVETRVRVDYAGAAAACDTSANPPGVPRLIPFAKVTREEAAQKAAVAKVPASYQFVPGSVAVAIEADTIDAYSARCAKMLAAKDTEKASPKTAAPSAPQKVAVYELTPSGAVDAALVEKLTASLAASAAKLKGITASVSRAIPEYEQKRLVVGCDDTACIGEIGASLGVDAVISGSVIRLDDGTWFLSLLLIDAKKPQILGRTTVKAKNTDELLGKIDAIAGELLTKPKP